MKSGGMMNSEGRGTGRKQDKRERLRHQEMQCNNQPNERYAMRGGGVMAEAQEEEEVKAPVDNRQQHNERGADQEPKAPTE